MILDNTSIQKQYQSYLIKLSSDLDIINISIEKDNTIYESNFNLEELRQHRLLMSSLTTQEIKIIKNKKLFFIFNIFLI